MVALDTETILTKLVDGVTDVLYPGGTVIVKVKVTACAVPVAMEGIVSLIAPVPDVPNELVHDATVIPFGNG